MSDILAVARKRVGQLTKEEKKLLQKWLREHRSKRSVSLDMRSMSKHIPVYVKTWIRHPNRYDIPGVDTPSTPPTQSKRLEKPRATTGKHGETRGEDISKLVDEIRKLYNEYKSIQQKQDIRMSIRAYDKLVTRLLRLFGYNTSFTELYDKFNTTQLRVTMNDIDKDIEDAKRIGLDISDIESMPEYKLFKKLRSMRIGAILVKQEDGEDLDKVREKLIHEIEETYDIKLPSTFKKLIEVVRDPIYPKWMKVYIPTIKGIGNPLEGRSIITNLLFTIWLSKHPDVYQKLLKLKERLDEKLRDIIERFRVQEERDDMMKVVSLTDPKKWLKFKWSFSKSSRYNRDFLPFLGNSRNVIATIQVKGDDELVFKIENRAEKIARDLGLEVEGIRRHKRGGISIRLVVGTTRDPRFRNDKKAYQMFNREVERFIESLLVDISNTIS